MHYPEIVNDFIANTDWSPAGLSHQGVAESLDTTLVKYLGPKESAEPVSGEGEPHTVPEGSPVEMVTIVEDETGNLLSWRKSDPPPEGWRVLTDEEAAEIEAKNETITIRNADGAETEWPKNKELPEGWNQVVTEGGEPAPETE